VTKHQAGRYDTATMTSLARPIQIVSNVGGAPMRSTSIGERGLAASITIVLALWIVPVAAAQGALTRAAYDSIDTDSMAESYMQSSLPFAASACEVSIRAEKTMSHEILLRASPVDTESAVAVQADLMAQDVASQVVALLGGTEDKVPVADRSVTWRSLPSQLLVTIHPDGRVTRRGVSAWRDTIATSLLVRAFDAARANGAARIIVPDAIASRPVVVRLVLDMELYVPGGQVKPPASAHPGFAAFMMPYATESMALPKPNNPRPRYPDRAVMSRMGGYVIMRFIVDTLGRVEPASIHDLWPSDKPRLTGYLAADYDDFVSAVKAVLPTWRFTPALLGSCPRGQVVDLPIAFGTAGEKK
jgi:hypothetical protein